MPIDVDRTDRVLQEILSERIRQADQLGFTLDHDAQHATNDWIVLLARYVGMATVGAWEHDPEAYRRRLIQIAAIAVAGVENLDRVTERAG